MEKLGIEMEFMLLDEKTLELVDKIDLLMNHLPQDDCITYESFQSSLEIRTNPVPNVSEGARQIKEKLNTVNAIARTLDIRLCALGTHPFSKNRSQVTAKQRYLTLEQEFPYISRNHLTFSNHVHVSMDSLQQSLLVMSRLRFLSPLFIALSASCPFWDGQETGFVSFRQYLTKVNLHGGIPPRFKNETDFNLFLSATTKSGMIGGLKDLHWDIRPRPDYGTLEYRIMDAVPDLDQAIALVALVRCTMVALKHKNLTELLPSVFRESPPEWSEEMNIFQAYHMGIEARFLTESNGNFMNLKDVGFELINSLEQTAYELQESDHLKMAAQMLQGGLPYEEIYKSYELDKSLKGVVKQAVETLDKGMSARTHS